MDLTFKTEEGIFNYRVCAIILHNGALLTTKHNNSPYYFPRWPGKTSRNC